MKTEELIDGFSRELGAMHFSPPVTHVYNTLAYAREPHLAYWKKYGGSPKKAVFLGMNPGPWGMAQTGVPFGEIGLVRDWLRVEGKVASPHDEHPKKRVEGFSCRRSEVSGGRLWGFFRRVFGSPERFFQNYFVHNYCPLMFLEEGGRNRTPDKLPALERAALEAVCDDYLGRAVNLLGAEMVVGVGAYAEAAALRALRGTGLPVGRITHPSPANPRANRDWEGIVKTEIKKLGHVMEGF